LARWLETDFVCDRRGRRWTAAWRDDVERKASRSPRVRIAADQLQRWYRTLDQLLARKAEIEHALFLRLRDLFSLRVDLVFYDLTSTYFEGNGPPRLGAYGHSRDEKPRNPQVLVGLVMVDGWPIAHHVFEGNRRDAMTVPDVLSDLEQRFGLKRIVFVGDRGMVTSRNLEDLRSGGHGYIVGRNRRRSEEVFDYIQRATGPWIECPVGITAREKTISPKTLVQEVSSNKPGVRVFVVHSDERLAYEQAQRAKSMDRVRTKLEALERRVANGRLKAPEKIGAAAAGILARNHGHRYYGWAYEKEPSASSSTLSTSLASRPTKANTSSRPKSPIYRRSRLWLSTKSFPKSNAPSPISKTSSTCGRSIIKPPIECRRTFLSRHWRLRSIAPLKKS
jgi:transposase